MSQAIDNIKDATLITWYENELHNSNNMSNSKSLNSIETTDDKLKDYVIKYTSYKDLKQDYNKSKSDTIKKMKMLEVAKDLARMHNSIIQEIATSASCEEEYNIWKKYI